jgi:PAS domain S-box-containing protein
MDSDTLRQENDSLRRRVAELERALAEREAASKASTAFYEGIIDNSPFFIYVKDREGRYLLVNDLCQRVYRAPKSAILGKTDIEFFPQGEAEMYMEADRKALEAGTYTTETSLVFEGALRHFVTAKFALRDAAGVPYAVCSVSLDISERKQVEAEAQRLQEEIIRVQEATLRALSTPLLPIAEGVVAMPLIGHINPERARQVLEALLEGVVAHQASMVILDVTGVPVVDVQVADALVQVAQAVRLLGAQTILTGIQPAIARTLVDLDADLGGVVTLGTLHSGIAHALGKRAAQRPGWKNQSP